MFCIEQVKNSSKVYKYLEGQDQSCSLALLSSFLKSAFFNEIALFLALLSLFLKSAFFFLPDSLSIAFAKLAKMAIFATFQKS